MINSETNISLRIPFKLPVRIIRDNGLPQLLAGGIPAVPINVALQKRWDKDEATEASLETYARAAKLYLEFAAHLRCSLIEITNDDFNTFSKALRGTPFIAADGTSAQLQGNRSKRTSDLMISLMYALAIDIEAIYQVRFDWRRYRGLPVDYTTHVPVNYKTHLGFRREHRIKWRPRKVLGLPDHQFDKLLCAAYERWGGSIAAGDRAYIENAESQRGALFYRNSAILMLQRYGGARRGEIHPIEFTDIRPEHSILYLVTKGHGGMDGVRLPVILFPAVRDLIWQYVTQFRPITPQQGDKENHAVFLSHSIVNYGQCITAQTVRKIIENLRPHLDAPWNKLLTPHMLRHSFAYDLQRLLGETGVTINMRHASSQSSAPYAAGVEVFGPELIDAMNGKIGRLLQAFIP